MSFLDELPIGYEGSTWVSMDEAGFTLDVSPCLDECSYAFNVNHKVILVAGRRTVRFAIHWHKNRLHDYLESMGWPEIARNWLERLYVVRM